MFEFGEDLFNRVEVRGVFREKEELGSGGTDELPHRLAFVTSEIVYDDDIAFVLSIGVQI